MKYANLLILAALCGVFVTMLLAGHYSVAESTAAVGGLGTMWLARSPMSGASPSTPSDGG